ncbi:MAG: hypothetical protein AAGJ39_06585 [Pseudomonadota bacterium]
MKRGILLRNLALGTALGSVLALPVVAQQVVEVPVGANTERADGAPGGNFDDVGFSISIDNETIAGAPAPAVPDRTNDIRAERAGIAVRFDGLDTTRRLNVSTDDLRAAYRAGETVTFRASMNYPAYVDRTEVRILDRTRRGNPVLAIVPIAPNGTASWVMPADGPSELAYVLRTYDARGRYDETKALGLLRTERAFDTHETTGTPFVVAGEGEDRTQVRRIPVSGGTITVSGDNARPRSTVLVMGEPVPTDNWGRFATSRILPAGDRVVTVEVDGITYVRDVTIPASDWFKVGIIDITAGWRRDGSIGEDETYIDGRAAIYATGRTQSGWQITGSLDTGNGPIDEIFTRLNDKDPRRVLDRLRDNDDDLYPTYGDDSTSYDDTPSQGRVYLRVENETTRFTWGDFKAGVNDGGLISNTRDLYGAELRYQTPSVTENGDPRFAAQAYLASPETAVQRDILRGTGGSVYFLTRQDITGGSVNAVVQTVDPDTGRVTSSRTLVEGVDYRVDYLQGVLILSGPIGTAVSDGGLVSDGTGTFDQNLVVQYEFTPTAGTGDATAYGGRAEVWASDRLRFGATLMSESTGTGDQQMSGADVRYQISEGTFAEFEFANTNGPGISRSTSTDGGLSITATGGGIADANAFRFDSRIDFADLGFSRAGYIGLYAEQKDAGFSTLSEDITDNQSLYGAEGEIALSDRLMLKGYIETFNTDAGERKDSAEANLIVEINPDWQLGLGVEFLDQVVPGDATRTGSRTDGALRLTYRGFDDLEVFAFGQATLARSGGLSDNNRLGAGFDAQISEKLSASGAYSDGDLGPAGAFRLTYTPTADDSYYIGYDLEATDVTGATTSTAENGTVVAGARTRHNDEFSSFAESRVDLPAALQASTNALGVNYTPNARWSYGATYETGTVRDDVSGDFDRDAVSAAIGYANEDFRTANLRLEYRTENGDGDAQDRVTWGVTAGYSNKVNQDWRFLASLDALVSESAEDDFRDGRYTKLRVGYAYRPLANERLNLLFGYTYLEDLPGEDQVDANGDDEGPLQRSHVVSVNGSYDLSEKLTFGGKVGYRTSAVADRGTDVFTSNSAALLIARLDWHVIHKWDALGEVRYLHTAVTGTNETGAVVGAYRHVGNNAKIGLGYEFGNVSDDLTDIDYTNQGLFVNLIAKF